MRGSVSMALVGACVGVWRRCAVHGKEQSRSKSSIADQPNTSQVPGERRLVAHAQQRVGARHEIELPG